MRSLRRASNDRPVGIYANVGWFTADEGWRKSNATDPDVYVGYALDWISAGVRILGGCCGTTPEHIARLRRLLDENG